MKTYLGVIYFKSKPKKKTFIDRFFKTDHNPIVHRFSDCLIQAETNLEAREKMKAYTDDYISKAKLLPGTEFMNDLIYESFVTEQI